VINQNVSDKGFLLLAIAYIKKTYIIFVTKGGTHYLPNFLFSINRLGMEADSPKRNGMWVVGLEANSPLKPKRAFAICDKIFQFTKLKKIV
jgi:hypothetical protein